MISRMAASPAQNPIIATGARRYALLACGCCNVALGLIGAVVPGMPTTIFLIIAVWAFSKCSVRFQRWLWDHPMFGPSIRNWHQHRVIPQRTKILAYGMMAASFALLTFFVAESWILPAGTAAVRVPVCAYIVTRASVVPDSPEASG